MPIICKKTLKTFCYDKGFGDIMLANEQDIINTGPNELLNVLLYHYVLPTNKVVTLEDVVVRRHVEYMTKLPIFNLGDYFVVDGSKYTLIEIYYSTLSNYTVPSVNECFVYKVSKEDTNEIEYWDEDQLIYDCDSTRIAHYSFKE